MTPTLLDIDTLTQEVAAAAGLDEARTRDLLAGALGLIDRHGQAGTNAALYAAVPGAEALARSEAARPRKGGGLFGGLMKSAGGVSGAAMAEAMGLVETLKRQGLDREALKPALKALRNRVKAATGRDLVGDAIRAVPGVGSLLGGS